MLKSLTSLGAFLTFARKSRTSSLCLSRNADKSGQITLHAGHLLPDFYIMVN